MGVELWELRSNGAIRVSNEGQNTFCMNERDDGSSIVFFCYRNDLGPVIKYSYNES